MKSKGNRQGFECIKYGNKLFSKSNVEIPRKLQNKLYLPTISAHRHCGRIVVTASVNNVSFEKPIPRASIVTLEAKVSRAFKSSMEVFVDVWMENQTTKGRVKCNEAIYTFVAVDQLGNPISVPSITAESDLEKDRYDGALRRRQLSLILSGRLKPEDATELKALFT